MKLKDVMTSVSGRVGLVRMSREFHDDLSMFMMAAINKKLTILSVDKIGDKVTWVCRSGSFKELESPEDDLPEYIFSISKTVKEVEDVNDGDLDDNECLDPNHRNVVFSYKAAVRPHPKTMGKIE